MKGGNISDDAIEQITMATIQAFEKLKELQTGNTQRLLFAYFANQEKKI